jgi:uncharacterized membrane protein YhhN
MLRRTRAGHWRLLLGPGRLSYRPGLVSFLVLTNLIHRVEFVNLNFSLPARGIFGVIAGVLTAQLD